MRFDKFTVKSQELIQNAQSLASGLSHQQIEPEHLLAAMLSEREGTARALLQKLGASADGIAQELKRTLEAMAKVSGAGDVYLSPRSRPTVTLSSQIGVVASSMASLLRIGRNSPSF